MDLDNLVEKVKEKLKAIKMVPIEASGRHIHLSISDAEKLFGKGYEFTILKELSQTKQYAYKEKVRVIGPKGIIEGVRILGPCREATQVELSVTDCKTLGIESVLRLSGDIKDTPGAILINGENIVKIAEGVIVAKNHIHMTPQDAQRLDVKNGDEVRVKILGKRPLTFEDVLIRVNPNFRLNMHLDYDEANACMLTPETFGIIYK